ncbi:glucosaminidase domain-containing protein [Anaerorhabdus sp.]|uniref:N-acetylglucosaminidase n=1 Tax=Anaerorhabdus sp. TaxID=1872524 RepID=UPI002B1FC39D|nr:glucosaminidase domain-containing protein [Anaerorhabdus sp.]MEA4875098.1 glucosaminidase domain-containing protein [Anaerorhabdus sp.]
MVNRIIKLLLSISMIAVSFTILDTPVFNFVTETQADMTSTSCGNNYEVAIANAGGSFTSKGCYNDFGSAQNAMKGLGDNAVVRHSSSKSPMKIVSMVSGIAVTYPMRSGSSTMNITQDHSSSNKKVTYVTKHREMKYFETRNYNGSGNGTVSVNITGFTGTADLMNVDLVPYVMLGNDTTVLLGGNDTSGKNEQPFWTHVYQSHYEVRQNGNNKELTFYAYSGWSNDNWPEVYTMTVGLAADWMVPGTRYYSYDGYNFYSDNKCTNKVGTYYNYYQFLPTRTKSNISASVFDNFLVSVKGSGTNSKMKGQGQTFINAQNTYGMNALLVYSLACLESAYGTSTFALERNNLFGWNAFDSDPGSASYFSSVEAAINEHMGINLRGYTDINDFRFFGSHVGNKGSGFNVKYAADPYWGYKIAAIAYSIDKASGFADLNKYSVGVINTYGVNVLKSPNGAVLFNSKYGETYQENFTVAVLVNESNHYKIQSTNPVASGNIITTSTKGLVSYDWNQSIGYIPTGYVTMLGGSAPSVEGTVPTGDPVKTISKIVISGTDLIIEGSAYRPGIYITNDNKITQTLRMYNRFFETTDITMTTTTADKDKASFTGKISLPSLTEGKYYFNVISNYSKYTDYNQTFNVIGTGLTLPAKTEIEGKIYEFTLDGNVLFVNVSNSQVTPQPTPTPTSTPEETPETNPSYLYQVVKSVKLVENSSIIHISGRAFITQMDATADSNITHTINLVNMQTGNKIDFVTSTSETATPLNLYDNYTYKKIQYDADIDMTTIPEGEYSVNITVKNGEREESSIIYTVYEGIPSNTFTSNGLGIEIYTNSRSKYRLEVSSKKSILDKSTINKPTRRSSAIGIYSIKVDDNENLLMDAYSYIGNTYMNAENNPSVKLIVQSEDGTISNEYNGSIKSCKTDFAAINKTQYTVKNACYDINQSIKDLPKGKYIVNVQVETTNTVNEKNIVYKDIYEVYSATRSKEIFQVGEKSYTINWSSIRDRLEIIIE